MTVNEDGSVIYAVYGTLRQGFGNNRLLQEDGVEFLGSMRTEPKFKMVSLGGFPAVKENGESSVLVELFKVTNPSVIRRVNSLEGYTGKRNSLSNWYDTCEINTEYGTANMFIMNNCSSNVEVTDGDWKNFIGKRWQ